VQYARMPVCRLLLRVKEKDNFMQNSKLMPGASLSRRAGRHADTASDVLLKNTQVDTVILANVFEFFQWSFQSNAVVVPSSICPSLYFLVHST
jgi:hypothetical protein